jgi:MFS family permease
MGSQSKWGALASVHDYRLLWLGQVISTFGESIYQVAFFWLAYEMSSSAWIAGLVVFCASAPYILFGLIGGVYADRWNRKNIMLVCDLVRAAAVAIVPLIAAMMAFELQIWHLGAVAFILTTARCFFHPSLNASVASVLTDDVRAAGVALVEGGFRGARLTGLALGGLLIEVWGAELVYIIAIATFLISVGFVLPLQNVGRVEDPEEGDEHILGALRNTFVFLRGHRDLFWGIMLFGIGMLFVTGLERVALPRIADAQWGVGASGFGWILAMITIGYVVASLVLGRMTFRSPSMFIFGGWALWGGFFAVLALTGDIKLALVVAFMIGVAEAVTDIPLVVLIQQRTPSNRMGKVFSMWSTVAFIGESLSALLIGALIAQTTTVAVFIICGAGTLAMAVFGLIASRIPDRAEAAPDRVT